MAENDSISQQEARQSVEAAYAAFRTVARFSQQQIDAICSAMSSAALAEAARLGQLANEETGFGRADDKREKNRFAAEDVWGHFRGLKTVGVVADKVTSLRSLRREASSPLSFRQRTRHRRRSLRSLSRSNLATRSCFRRIRLLRIVLPRRLG